MLVQDGGFCLVLKRTQLEQCVVSGRHAEGPSRTLTKKMSHSRTACQENSCRISGASPPLVVSFIQTAGLAQLPRPAPECVPLRRPPIASQAEAEADKAHLCMPCAVNGYKTKPVLAI